MKTIVLKLLVRYILTPQQLLVCVNSILAMLEGFANMTATTVDNEIVHFLRKIATNEVYLQQVIDFVVKNVVGSSASGCGMTEEEQCICTEMRDYYLRS